MTTRRHRAGSLAITLALVAGACQSGPDGSSATAAPPGATSPNASALPAATEPTVTATPPPIAELIGLTLDDSAPIITIEDGPPGARYALPAAGARAADGTYVLVIIWFPSESSPEPPMIALATSPDAHTWTVGKEPIITDLGVGGDDPGPIPAALVQLDDGSWLMYGWAADDIEGSHFSSWRASAPDLEGPWKLDRDRVISTGPAGKWDSQAASIGAVQRTPAGFAAWYEGQTPGSTLRGDIGYATSTDGLVWQKYDDPATTVTGFAQSDPVVRRDICGRGTSRAVYQPQVEVGPGGGYVMVFGGFGGSGDRMDLFGAVSADGIHWDCGTPEALLKTDGIPNSEMIHTIASFPLGDGRMGLIIESLGNARSDLWYATIRLLD